MIVPAYKGRATIAGCLNAILKASGRWRTEILVIESSGDGTVEFVRQSFPQVTVFASPVRLSAGGARNEGFRRARGTWLLCVDQDCLVPEDWIDRLVALLQQPGTGAAGGSIAVANPGNRSGWCVYYLEFLNHFPSSGAVRTDNFLIGANSAWHPEVARQIGFPDQTLGEDLLFSEAIRQQGLAVRYDASLTVHHHNREGWSEFTRYCRAMGDAAAVDQSRLGGWAVVSRDRGIQGMRGIGTVSPHGEANAVSCEGARSAWPSGSSRAGGGGVYPPGARLRVQPPRRGAPGSAGNLIARQANRGKPG